MTTAVRIALGVSVAGVLLASGCATRTIAITSEPAGAIVWLNDVEVGRTPLEADFKHYGEYDVRLRLEGYVPISTHRDASAPINEEPPFDLLLAWMPTKNVVRWNFKLEPLPETVDRPAAERDVLDRAKSFRESQK